jgi:hypothetical protein
MNLVVFPDKIIRAFDPANPRGSRWGEVQPLSKAWGSQPGDAHTVGYAPAGAKMCPRYAKGQAALATEHGVFLRWLSFDIDNPNHTPWSDAEQSARGLQQCLDAVSSLGLPRTLSDAVGGYTTRAGLRLVWALVRPVDVKHADHLLRHLGERLMDAGIAVDPACFQWTRLYRLPAVVRDGVPQLPSIEEPEPWDGDIHQALGIEPVESTGAQPVDADMPSGPLDIPAHVLNKGCIRFPELARHEPLTQEDASLFRTYRTALASVASRANVTSPSLLLSVAWRSIEASGRDPSEFWRLCCWLAAEQELNGEAVEAEPEWEHTPPERWEGYKPSQKWWTAASRAAKATKKSTPPRVVRTLRAGKPISIERTKPFAALETFIDCVSSNGSPLSADPKVLWAAMMPSVENTSTKNFNPAIDLWPLCVEAAQGSWEKSKEQLEADGAQAVEAEVLEAWPLLVTNGIQYYVLDAREGPGHYTYHAVTSEQAVPIARKFQASLPIDLMELTAGERGGMVSAPTLLDRAGRIVDSVVYKSGLGAARFVESGRKLLLPCHRRAKLEPLYNADVDMWLHLLAGKDYERLARWVAGVPLTSTGPLACLYLEGKKSCGKTLLCTGLGHLFAGGLNDYNSLTYNNFNGEMLTSPMLLADEGIYEPKYSNGANSPSNIFRSFTANSEHKIEAKYREPVNLEGFLRVVVTGNGPDAIPFKESLGRNGIEAITERIFHIFVGEASKAFLEEHVTQPVIQAEWLEKRALARHLLWLSDTVDPGSDGRFLVAGVETPWHQRFAQNQGLKPEMCVVLGHLASSIIRTKSKKPGVIITPDALLVHHDAAADAWNGALGSSAPRLRTVRKTLRALSESCLRYDTKGMEDATGRWYHRVPWQTLEDADVLDEDTLKKIRSNT